MKQIHVPRIDARYWTAITLASIFGTNLGDFYAHESGLTIGAGLAVLAALAAIVFFIERHDDRSHEIYYWLVIILIRTGATNIADYLAFRARIPLVALTLSLLGLLFLFGWGVRKSTGAELMRPETLPKTGAPYWLAMLTAGVFGTVVGDICSHAIGQGAASLTLGALLAVTLFAYGASAARHFWAYWAIVGVARTAGTAMGDWFAENKTLAIGLPLSTLITGCAFVAVVLVRRRPKRDIGLAG